MAGDSGSRLQTTRTGNLLLGEVPYRCLIGALKVRYMYYVRYRYVIGTLKVL